MRSRGDRRTGGRGSNIIIVVWTRAAGPYATTRAADDGSSRTAGNMWRRNNHRLRPRTPSAHHLRVALRATRNRAHMSSGRTLIGFYHLMYNIILYTFRNFLRPTFIRWTTREVGFYIYNYYCCFFFFFTPSSETQSANI